MNSLTKIDVINKDGDLVVDSRLIADELGIEHEVFMRTVKKYETKIQQRFGIIRFETKNTEGRGRPKKYALLTEAQCKFLLSKSRNGLNPDAISKFNQLDLDFSSFVYTSADRKRIKESEYSNNLSNQLNGKREVKTLAGNIDVLTNTEIIEVKTVSAWKSALGQVVVYGHYYPSHQRRIHLYGETQKSFLAMIRSHCEKFGVIVTWEA